VAQKRNNITNQEPREGPKLTDEQVKHFKSLMIPNGQPVRFMYEGCALNIISGQMQKKSINIIYQRCYWNFSHDTSLEIAKVLGVKAVFSE
jgi:hypothetical protein